MSFFVQAIRRCITGTDYPKVNIALKENAVAADVLKTLFEAEKGGQQLKKKVQDIVGEYGWTENIAVAILHGLADALEKGAQMGGAMKEAFEKAFSEASAFAHDHPIFCTVVALGILVLLMPWALEAVGFAELGPVEGTFAAVWQSTYRGLVPKKSLFSFFQRLGMVWRRSMIKATL